MPEGEEQQQEIENLFEQITKENFSNLAKEIDFQEVQEAQRVPKKLDPRKNMTRHIIITLAKLKDKERILKAAREKELQTKEFLYGYQLISQKKPCRPEGKEIFKVVKGKNLHPRLLHPAKIPFRMEGQIKCFPDNVKLKSSSSPSHYYMKC